MAASAYDSSNDSDMSVRVLHALHERQVDRKDAIIQMLDRDLEEADEQHQMVSPVQTSSRHRKL